jgi:hypothetical protein
MKTIGQLLESKGKDIWSIAPGESVYEALQSEIDAFSDVVLSGQAI